MKIQLRSTCCRVRNAVLLAALVPAAAMATPTVPVESSTSSAATLAFADHTGARLGLNMASGASTVFFHTATIDGRAWIVAPDGQRQLFLGIDHVRPSSWKDRTLGYDVYGRFVKTNYPSKEAWLEETIGQLQSWGFNTLANHCDEPLLRHRGLAHTVTLYLGGKFARGKDPDRWITEWRGPDGDIWSHVAPNGPPVFERDIVTGADLVTLRGEDSR